MQRRGVAWLLASAVLLCCPSAAEASIDAALKTFNGAWPQGCPQVTIEQAEDVDPTVSGFATPGTCVVYLTPSFLSRSPQPETICAVVVHEYGHLLGLGHSDDEGNVMFPSPLPPAACQPAEDTSDAQAADAPVRAEIGDITASAGGQQPTTGSELHTTKSSRRTCFKSRARASASSRSSSVKRRTATRRVRRASSCRR